MKFWLKQVLVAFDQFCNAVFFGWADETFSSRCYREYPKMAKVIDVLFWFDANHCRESYMSERERNQLPPEFRDA